MQWHQTVTFDMTNLKQSNTAVKDFLRLSFAVAIVFTLTEKYWNIRPELEVGYLTKFVLTAKECQILARQFSSECDAHLNAFCVIDATPAFHHLFLQAA
ncbi:hypothetical protein PoB_006995000 [Plakobranchus ocellatus]|uniref:Uncharacterized protein n=1 Tax=Plakobranchus ocellatus TaxID=259542 RepID=A0AAV4DHJ9_9GAST|nr:hypothetical protein PoB_006995000 [Plakobranchus ocellatus]